MSSAAVVEAQEALVSPATAGLAVAAAACWSSCLPARLLLAAPGTSVEMVAQVLTAPAKAAAAAAGAAAPSILRGRC